MPPDSATYSGALSSPISVPGCLASSLQYHTQTARNPPANLNRMMAEWKIAIQKYSWRWWSTDLLRDRSSNTTLHRTQEPET